MGRAGGVRSEGGWGGVCLFVCLQCADSWVVEPPSAPRIQPVHPKTPKKEPLLSLHQYRPIDAALSKLQPELYRHQLLSLPSPHMLCIHPQTEERNYPLPSPSPVACSFTSQSRTAHITDQPPLRNRLNLPSPPSLPPLHAQRPNPQFTKPHTKQHCPKDSHHTETWTPPQFLTTSPASLPKPRLRHLHPSPTAPSLTPTESGKRRAMRISS